MIVVDASVAIKWLFTEERTEEALNLLTAALAAKERIVAPPLLSIEVANILRQRMHGAGLTLAQALDLYERFQKFPITSESPSGLSRQALTIADRYQLPAVYDAHYIALAEILEAALWTDDRRLIRTLGGRLPFVKWIGDYGGENDDEN